MNIDEVLLTREETFHICNNGLDCSKLSCDDCLYQKKAQALKLLEWLKEKCEEHPIPVPAEYGVPESAGFAYVNRANCPQCMSELEAMLREV
jgi:hypothetical protein